MEEILICTFILPLFGAIWTAISRHRFLLTILYSVHFLLSGLLVFHVFTVGAVATSIGNWAAPYGIVLIADPLSALMLLFASLIFLVTTLDLSQELKVKLSPLLLMLEAGVSLSLITGDLFNLFVAFEIMLMSSYGVLLLASKSKSFGNIYSYLSMNIVASLLFLVAVAVFYGSTGTLNFASMSEVLMNHAETDILLALAAIGLVFAIKGGVFPLYFWLPDSYPLLPGPLAGLFAGTLSKVGIYALIRVCITLFGFALETYSAVLLLFGCATMFFGVMGAVSRGSVKEILSYHILSQIGYVIFALSIGTVTALASAIFFLIHNMVVKSSLFLIGELAEKKCQSDHLSKMGGLLANSPFLSALFFLQALSLAGLPPLSGFWGKYMILFEGLKAESYLAVVVATVVSFFTLYSMVKIWNYGFLGESVKVENVSKVSYTGSVILTVVAVGMGLFVSTSYGWCHKAAESIYDHDSYIAISMTAGSKGRE